MLYLNKFTLCEVLDVHSCTAGRVTYDVSTDRISFFLKGQAVMYSLSVRQTSLKHLQ